MLKINWILNCFKNIVYQYWAIFLLVSFLSLLVPGTCAGAFCRPGPRVLFCCPSARVEAMCCPVVGAVASCAELCMLCWVFCGLVGADAPRASRGALLLLRPSRGCVLHGGVGAVASCAGLSLRYTSVLFRFLVLSLLSLSIRLPSRAARLRRTRTGILYGMAITKTSSSHPPVSAVLTLAWTRPGRVFLGFLGGCIVSP